MSRLPPRSPRHLSAAEATRSSVFCVTATGKANLNVNTREAAARGGALARKPAPRSRRLLPRRSAGKPAGAGAWLPETQPVLLG